MHGKRRMTIDDPFSHRSSHTTSMGNPHCLSYPKTLQPRPFSHKREIVNGEGEQTIHRFDNVAVLQCGSYFGRTFHGTFPVLGSEWHLARHYFCEFARKDFICFHRKWPVTVPSNCETLSPLLEIKVRTLMTEHWQFSFTLVSGKFKHRRGVA